MIHYSDDIELIFIELPKFNKELDELTELQDKWIYFIKNAGKLDFVPQEIDENIQTALGIANEANFSIEELELQRKRKEFIYIQKSSIELAKEQGFEAGRAEGYLAEYVAGETQNQKKMVLNCHKLGVEIDVICTITELNEDVVKSIVNGVDNDECN